MNDTNNSPIEFEEETIECKHKKAKLSDIFEGKIKQCIRCLGVDDYVEKLVKIQKGKVVSKSGTTTKTTKFEIVCEQNHKAFELQLAHIRAGKWCKECIDSKCGCIMDGSAKYLGRAGYLCQHNNLAVLYPNLAKEWDHTKNGGKNPEDFLPCSGEKI